MTLQTRICRTCKTWFAKHGKTMRNTICENCKNCKNWVAPVWGIRVAGLINPQALPLFFKYFRQFKEKRRPGTFAILAPRLYNRYNHAHVPGPHMLQSPGSGPGSKCSKTVEVGCSYSELKPCQPPVSARSPLTKSKKKKKLSVHWRAQCHAKWPRRSRRIQHHAGCLQTINNQP